MNLGQIKAERTGLNIMDIIETIPGALNLCHVRKVLKAKGHKLLSGEFLPVRS